MKARWELVLAPPLVVSFLLLAASQVVFLRGSLFEDLRLGRRGTEVTLKNYMFVFTDEFYLDSLDLTFRLSATVAILTILFSFPVAYILARMRSRWSLLLLAAIVVTSFVSIVIKVLGLVIIFSADGQLNRLLLALGVLTQPYSIIGNPTGVAIGLMHFTLGFAVLLQYGVMQTIPRSLEEAAEIHGASRWRVFQRIIIPLTLPGTIVSLLTVFNLCMGAFTSAALIGGGKVLTLPVVIQRTILFETKYGVGATISAVLLVVVVVLNLLSIFLLSRLRASRRVTA
ncbi:MAG: ABC transporter permease [Pseudomonadota bacterium]